jgi:imidazolonepropionase-like amidohydrolase
MAGEGALTPHQALRAATLSGAQYMGLQDTLGSIETGKMADMIILNSNPLTDIHNSTDISWVLKNGEVFE